MTAALAAHADPTRAAGQQRYLRSRLPLLGLSKPQLTAALRPVLADPAHRIEDRAQWEATIRTLWDGATYRDHWYAALALARHRLYRGFRDVDTLPLYRHLIETGAWWDVVDEVATQLVREILLADPEQVTPIVRGWITEPSPWLRRSAIICQVGAKQATDTDLLLAAIEPHLDDRDFFLRKAIGWALRDYARSDPDWVRGQVARLGGRLSPLSRREATKHL